MDVFGLSHITLISSDLNRFEEIITKVLSAQKIYDSGSEQFSLSEERFYLIGKQDFAFDQKGLWLAVMKGEPHRIRDYHHVAFSVAEDYLEKAERIVDELGLEKKPARPRVKGEGSSLYFYDFDNHLFELHSGTLSMRLERYKKGL